jgi:hypothetical protein
MNEGDKKLSGEREAAKAASQGCRECCGSGVTSRYDEVNTGPAAEYVSVGCICHLCQMGDFVREAREATGEQSLAAADRPPQAAGPGPRDFEVLARTLRPHSRTRGGGVSQGR